MHTVDILTLLLALSAIIISLFNSFQTANYRAKDELDRQFQLIFNDLLIKEFPSNLKKLFSYKKIYTMKNVIQIY